MGGLAEELADLLVHVAQEVHVGCPPAGALVLHQEALEDELAPVFLLHHHQLQRGRKRGGSKMGRRKRRGRGGEEEGEEEKGEEEEGGRGGRGG